MKRIFFLDNEKFKQDSGKNIFLRKLSADSIDIHSYSLNFVHNKEFYNPYWFQSWSMSPVFDGKSIRELFVFDNQSIWPFFEYLLFVDAYRMPLGSISRLLYYVDILEKVVEVESPDEVILQNDSELFYKIAAKFLTSRNIKFSVLGFKSTLSGSPLRTNVLLGRCYFYLRNKLRRFVGFLSCSGVSTNDVVLLSNERFCKGDNLTNVFWGSICKKLARDGINYSVAEYDNLTDFSSFWTMVRRHLLNKATGAFYVGSLYGFADNKKYNDVIDFCSSTWNKIKDSSLLKSSLNYKGVYFFDEIKDKFSLCFSVLSYAVADALILGETLVKRIKPKVVVMDHEMNFLGLGVLIASKNYPVKTVALQFESVDSRASVHRFIKNDIMKKKSSSLWRPLPDVKCASSDYAKQILVDYCNYSAKDVVVTGEPRYDRLKSEKFSSSSGKKVIVYATKFMDDEKPIWDKLCEIANRRDDLKVIFKLAPVNSLVDVRSKIKESDSVKIIQDYDILRLIKESDAIVTIRATTALEAVCLGRPVLIIDLFKTSPLPYVEEGAALEVKSVSGLEASLDSALYDKKTRVVLSSNSKAFVKKYMFKLDGKANERVVGVIKELL